MTDVWVNRRPLEEYGLVVTELSGWWSRPLRQDEVAAVVGAAGGWRTGLGTQFETRSLAVGIRTMDSTMAGRRAQVAALYQALTGVCKVSINDDPNRFVYAVLSQASARALDPALVEPRVDSRLEFLAHDPWVYSHATSWVGLANGVPKAIETGTAPHAGVLFLNGGGTSVKAHLVDRSGNAIQSLTFASNWAAGVTVRCNFHDGLIKTITAGVVANFENAIGVTEMPFVFDPADGPQLLLENTGGYYIWRKADLV